MAKLKPEVERMRAEALTKPVLAADFNLAEVARQRGVTRQTIQEQFHRPAVQSALQAALRKAGISSQYKAKKLKELLEAKKIQNCDVFIRDDNGTLKVNKNSNDFIEVEDNPTRLGALKLTCQIDKDIDFDEKKPDHPASVMIFLQNIISKAVDGETQKTKIHIGSATAD